MKTHFASLLNALSLPNEGTAAFQNAFERLNSAYPSLLEEAVSLYYENDFAEDPVTALLQPAADALKLPHRTLYFLLVACAAKRMKKEYEARQYDTVMYTDFLKDLTCKIGETYRWFGEWGINKITYWYPLFFKLQLFALGRLQYEIYQRPNVDSPVTVGGHTVEPQDLVYYIHIPGIGPLTKDLCMDSYRRAYNFFKDDLGNKPCVFYCGSWMLYERNREFMAPTSNIVRFMSDFKLVKSYEVPEQKYWWVFDRPYEGDASVLPRDTTLRRQMAEWLENGGKPGGGDGYFVFDGETVHND